MILQFRIFNSSTAKGGRGKITPQTTFLPITQTTRPAAKIPFVPFPEYVFARNGASLDFLWLRIMTSWRVKVTSFFWEKNEVSIYTFKCSGIMENWIKHEVFHLNNEIPWWHDMTHDNMSSHDIRHMTSRHDFISIKFDILLLLYVAVGELERWFYFCFAQYSGREIHSNLRR